MAPCLVKVGDAWFNLDLVQFVEFFQDQAVGRVVESKAPPGQPFARVYYGEYHYRVIHGEGPLRQLRDGLANPTRLPPLAEQLGAQ